MFRVKSPAFIECTKGIGMFEPSKEDKMLAVPLAHIARTKGKRLNTLRHAANKGYLKAWKQGRDWFTTEDYYEAWNKNDNGQIRRPRK